MLASILRSVQRFERTHGYAPNVVYLNADHWFALARECPGLCESARDGERTPLGFHVLILPRESLRHPASAHLVLHPAVRAARPVEAGPASAGAAAAA